MANPEVRAFPVYFNGKKIAEAYENDYKITTGRTRMMGAEGYYAHSKGATVTSLSINVVVPVKGVTFAMVEKALAQEDVVIGLPVNGKVHQVVMAITENGMKSNVERGTVEGTLTLEGGVPDVT